VGGAVSSAGALDSTLVLRDGSTVAVRPIQAHDEAALAGFYGKLSLESQAFRFFTNPTDVRDIAKRLAISDFESQFGLAAIAGNELVGHAVYVVTAGTRAEIGLAIADAYQGRGLGILLLGRLAEAAAHAGIEVFTAVVKADNHRMLDLLRDSGFPLWLRSEPGEVHADLPTALSPEARQNFERRDALAALAAVNRFLAPHSVAVIGELEPDTTGGTIVQNLLSSGFAGRIHLVNGTGRPVGDRICYKSVREIPEAVEMAVITVPAASVIDVAGECALKGVRALVVISGGFAESGPEGAELQRRLLDTTRRAGMRLIGPNCMGVLSTSPNARLNASLMPDLPLPGKIGFLSQSGSLGLAVMEHARAVGVGFSGFVSVGNNADISGNDLLQYWEADGATNLIMLYLESFRDPRTFARVARRVGRSTPILVVKGGRSAAGARASTAHTGALVRPSSIRLATSGLSEDALFQQAGIIQTRTLEELFETAQVLSDQPLPAGNRVAIITNAGGPAVLGADACEAHGLHLPELPEELRASLAAAMPRTSVFGNPVVMTPTAGPLEYHEAIARLASWPGVDALIVTYTPQVGVSTQEVAAAIRHAATSLPRQIPMLAVFTSMPDGPSLMRDERVRIPTYAFPEDAARALGHAWEYVLWRQAPEEPGPDLPNVDAGRAAAVIAATLAQGQGGWMSSAAVSTLLGCYGLTPAESVVAATPHEAGDAAKKLGGKVALKALAPGLIRKSDAGAVRLDLEGGHEVEEAAKEIGQHLEKVGQHAQAFIVQRMAPPGVEMLVGVVQDRHFGPVVAVGAAGRAVELFKDAQIRLTPLGRNDAATMIRSLTTYPLLDGYRGATPVSVAALEDVLIRVGALVEAHSEVADIDFNPVIVHPTGAVIVDARIRVEPVPY
jgi:acyl-CoA synthetase (NDP forming)/RimJ/RimL family protein N-acetyltransferase